MRIRRRAAPRLAAALALLLFVPASLLAQRGTVGTTNIDPGSITPREPPAIPRTAAPEDFTGYWVTLVTEDWLYLMRTPPKGDYESLPLTPEGKKAADGWDPAKDEAAGNQCKAYGAPAIMRIPGRVHITWENDSTLRIDKDAGTQTRLLHFNAPSTTPGPPQWQGYSYAEWELFGGGRGVPPQGGYLKVETTRLRPGYLRKNGVPYSADVSLTEYFSRVNEATGESYLIVTTVVEDRKYLSEAFVTSTQYRKIPDAAGWHPTPCVAR
jgi:hypothetical protein